MKELDMDWKDLTCNQAEEFVVLGLLSFFSEFSNIPLEHTPDPQPTVYEGSFIFLI